MVRKETCPACKGDRWVRSEGLDRAQREQEVPVVWRTGIQGAHRALGRPSQA